MSELEAGIEWARGPLFRAAATFMILGLLRHAAITLWEMSKIMYRAGDKVLPWRQVFIATLKWLFPIGQLRNRFLFSLTTLAFHISIILVPIFLAGHIVLWQKNPIS